MADTSFAVTAGSGTGLHTSTHTVGGVTAHDEVMVLGIPNLPSYSAIWAANASLATANAHVLQVMAGSSLNVYITRIRIYQSVLATTVTNTQFILLRLTTAGTGGTVLNTNPFDTAAAAGGATCMTLPTVKGTEGAGLWIGSTIAIQTLATGQLLPPLLELNFDTLKGQALRIPAGVANGLALKVLTATAAAAVIGTVEFFEASY